MRARIALDFGIAQCSASLGETPFLSFIRAKERAQAMIAKASERVALAKARKLAEETESQVQGQLLGVLVLAPQQMALQRQCAQVMPPVALRLGLSPL
jgi:hypothetical protein